MRVELVNTGTELLLGDTVNTNASWIGQRLAALGIQVARQTIVPDGAVIRVAIAEAAQRSDVVLVSGGLGPTNDDLTRESTAELLSLPMELNEGVLEHLTAYFAKRNKTVNDATKSALFRLMPLSASSLRAAQRLMLKDETMVKPSRKAKRP